MSSNPAPPADVRAGRPRVVEYALYAIVARCVFSVAASLTLFASRGSLTRSLAKSNPTWDAAKLHSQVSSAQKSNLIAAVGGVVVVLVIAKFIFDGRNWARWVFALISFVVTGDVLSVLNLFRGDSPGAYRGLTGLAGLAVIAAIFLLFLRAANPWFQPAGKVSASPLRMMFGGGRPVAPAPVAPAEPAVNLSKTKRPQPARRPNGSPRPAAKSPRAKSRRPAE